MQDLYIELQGLRRTLNSAIATLKKRGIDKAAAEAEYRKALAIKILEEREKGTPVTIINDICRGDSKIADLKMQRDIAESLYESCLQAIYSTKLNIDIVQNQMKAERKGE